MEFSRSRTSALRLPAHAVRYLSDRSERERNQLELSGVFGEGRDTSIAPPEIFGGSTILARPLLCASTMEDELNTPQEESRQSSARGSREADVESAIRERYTRAAHAPEAVTERTENHYTVSSPRTTRNKL